MFYRVLISL